MQKYKTRLVPKGFLQKYGGDYDEAFAPAVSYKTKRRFFAAVAYKKLKDKSTFLHRDLEEEVYITQPELYVVSGEEKKISN